VGESNSGFRGTSQWIHFAAENLSMAKSVARGKS
jgi:hypothetical protein